MNKLFGILICTLLVINCGRGKNDVSFENGKKDSLIVFFDIKHHSRKELSDFINIIDRDNPKLIGLGFLLPSLKSPREDSLLAASISNSGKVILAATARNDVSALSRSHELFTSVARGEGVLSYVIRDSDKLTNEYIPLYQDNDQQMLSFPNVIVDNAYPDELKDIAKFDINAPSKIYYYKSLSDFIVLDENNIRPDQVKDKIVIFGYLGNENEYRHNISIDGKIVGSYSCVVTANIILNLLSEPE